MERIQDGRRDILIHSDASVEDLPLSGLPELPVVASLESFVPENMSEPKLYPGDVIVGYDEGDIMYAELIYDKIDEGILVVDLMSGRHVLREEQQFSARFYNHGEVHIYDAVIEELPEWDVETEPDDIERPETTRAR
jgi:hypothetical protein